MDVEEMSYLTGTAWTRFLPAVNTSTDGRRRGSNTLENPGAASDVSMYSGSYTPDSRGRRSSPVEAPRDTPLCGNPPVFALSVYENILKEMQLMNKKEIVPFPLTV